MQGHHSVFFRAVSSNEQKMSGAMRRRATEKQVQWVLRLVVRAGRTPTPEFIVKLRSLNDSQIRIVTARAQSQADLMRKRKKPTKPAPKPVLPPLPAYEPLDFSERYPDNGIPF